MGKFTVLKDNREQKGWEFSPTKVCAGTEGATLPTGDYTLKGYEKILTIERKGTVAEIAQNLLQKRFENELGRLEGFRWPFLICEFGLDELVAFPMGSDVPWPKRKAIRTRGPFLLKKLTELEMTYRARVLLAGRKGKELALSIFKRAVELCPLT